MKGYLEGTKLSFMEAAAVTYDAGWERKPLAVAVATFAHESGLYERAHLDYEWWADKAGNVYAWQSNGNLTPVEGVKVGDRLPIDTRVPPMDYDGALFKRVYRMDQGFCQINSMHNRFDSTPIAAWEAKVYNFASNLAFGRGLFESARDRGLNGMQPWAAWSNGNYLRSYRIAKHAAANADAEWYTNTEITFRWWEQKWIPGDLPVWEMERSRRLLGPRWQAAWEKKHPKQAAILGDPTLGLAEEVDEDGDKAEPLSVQLYVQPFHEADPAVGAVVLDIAPAA